MQTVDSRFKQLSNSSVRPLSFQLRASFDKMIDESITFFTLDVSLLDGPDVLAPSDDNVIQEWDKYDYDDYTDRVVRLEYQREEDIPYSVVMAMADIQLNNYDNLFTRGSNGPLEEHLKPRRPFRILAGFGGNNIPQFVGLTETVPKADKSAGIALVHCVDFLSYLFEKDLDETVMLENVKTHEALDYILQLVGLLPDQYELDEGFNLINFLYFEKGIKVGYAFRQMMQAELGSLYMDEAGKIIFRNRLKSSANPVITFDASRIINYETLEDRNVYNVVRIKSKVLKVLEGEPIYNLPAVIEIFANSTLEKFFDYDDPITVANAPVFTANTEPDGSGTDITGSIVIEEQVNFSKSSKVVFRNDASSTAYITSLTITGNPARTIKDIDLSFRDDESIEEFEERPYPDIEFNDFIQSEDSARSLGLSILNYYKDFANTIELDVKGTHPLQIGDNFRAVIDSIDQVYSITKIVNIIEDSRFIQRIRGRIFNIPSFFILSSDMEARSLLNGNDVLAP